MGLEVAGTIDQLVPTNPAGTDNRAQGDDHIRLIKGALKGTFANFTGPVTISSDKLNTLSGDGYIMSPGMIVMWSGTVATIPAGWKLCNGSGTISNGSPVPNLVERFVMGSGTDSGGNYNVGATGGSANINLSGTTQPHTLTINEIPSHNHGSTAGAFIVNLAGAGNVGGGGNMGSVETTGPRGGGQAHSHDIVVNVPGANLPPFYALAFIIKN